MSRLNTLYQHAADISAEIKEASTYGIVPTDQYDLVRSQGTGMTTAFIVRSFKYLIYENNLEKLCRD